MVRCIWTIQGAMGKSAIPYPYRRLPGLELVKPYRNSRPHYRCHIPFLKLEACRWFPSPIYCPVTCSRLFPIVLWNCARPKMMVFNSRMPTLDELSRFIYFTIELSHAGFIAVGSIDERRDSALSLGSTPKLKIVPHDRPSQRFQS